MKLLLTVAFLLSSLSSFAVITDSVNLSVGKHVPLFNCGIYADSNVRETCAKLAKKNKVEFYDRGYAVDCQNLKKKNRKACNELADRLIADSSLLECNSLYGRAHDECQTTKDGYAAGRFEASIINSCSPEAYDRSYYMWKKEYDRRKKNGKTAAWIGIGATVVGTGLRIASNDRGVQAVGAGLQIGGLVLAQLGLIEMDDAYFSAPHSLSYCSGFYVPEVRRVIVDRQQCHATRYYQTGYYNSRYYTRVHCHTRSYVTFEVFSPWNSGY